VTGENRESHRPERREEGMRVVLEQATREKPKVGTSWILSSGGYFSPNRSIWDVWFMYLYGTFFFTFFCPYFLYPRETLSRCGKDRPVGDIDECLGRGGADGVE